MFGYRLSGLIFCQASREAGQRLAASRLLPAILSN